MKQIFYRLLITSFLGLALIIKADSPVPNIIIFLADDMGMGDTSAYQEFTKNKDAEQVYTPALNKLAEAGIRFTDGHSAAAVCHPSRVGLMRGGRPVDYNLPLGPVFPSMLQKAGYKTYGIGKWHIRFEAGKDYHANTPIKECALDYGFDHYTGTEHNTTYSPAFHIDRSHQYYDSKSKTLIPNPGKTAPGYGNPGGTLVEVQTQLWMNTFRKYLSGHAGDGEFKDKPFFLYYASHANHGPIIPADKVDGIQIIGACKTADQKPLLNDRNGLQKNRSEMILENDIAVGRLMTWLRKTDDPRNPGHKMIHNTLFIFSSDNGANSVPLGKSRRSKKGSDKKASKNQSVSAAENTPANGLFRGNKADIYEGGHRVPLIMSWPAKLPVKKFSSAQVCLSDLYATFATITNQKLSAHEAPDSIDILPVMLNPDREFKRESLYIVNKRKSEINSLVQNGFKLIWTMKKGRNIEFTELYSLTNDLGETKNLLKNPEYKVVLNLMKAAAVQIVEKGYTRVGYQKPAKE